MEPDHVFFTGQPVEFLNDPGPLVFREMPDPLVKTQIKPLLVPLTHIRALGVSVLECTLHDPVKAKRTFEIQENNRIRCLQPDLKRPSVISVNDPLRLFD